MESLEKMGSLKKLPKDRVFIEPGDTPKHCYIVKKGCIIGFEYTSGGDERVYEVMLPRSLLLEVNIFLNKPSPVYFKSLKPSELICVDKYTLLDQMGEDPRLVTDIIKHISYKYFVAMDQIRESKCHDTGWRFCSLLLMFADSYGVMYDGKILIKEKVSQVLFSNFLGVNRVTVNRIIKKLTGMGLIEQINGFYCICDKERLRHHMDYLET
jgi:CRP/FNR family transcriptional regulator